MKMCRICGGEHHSKGMCRKCYNKQYYNSHHEEILQQKKEYDSRPKVVERRKKYHRSDGYKKVKKKYENKLEVKLMRKTRQSSKKYVNYYANYREKNRYELRGYHQEPKNKNRRKGLNSTSEFKNRRNTLRRYKMKNDIIFNLSCKMRCRTRCFLRTKNMQKNNKTFKIIGCTPQELKIYIEKQFLSDMSWVNVLNGKIHIDHIIPLSSAKTEADVYRLCHYTNLQPLWAEDNISKNCSLDWVREEIEQTITV